MLRFLIAFFSSFVFCPAEHYHFFRYVKIINFTFSSKNLFIFRFNDINKVSHFFPKYRNFNQMIFLLFPLREKSPYSELFWSAFSRIRTEYGEILCISSYSFRMRENADQNNFEYGHFLRGAPSLFV